jgi:tetratricopeptide (TPR) repeat protein
MNYCKLHRFLFAGIVGLLVAQQASALPETRMQLKARELEMRSDYQGAILLYEKEKSHKNAEVAATSLHGIARCYGALGNFDQAESAYEQLRQRPPTAAAASILYEYAEVLLRNGKYAQAKQLAKEVQQLKQPDTSYAERAKRLVTTCNNAEVWQKKPTRHVVTPLSGINTCYSEWGAAVYSAQEMLFSSDRPMEKPDCSKSHRQGGYTSRAFSAASAMDNDALTWSHPKILPPPINKSGVHAGPFSMAANNMDLLYYTSTGKKKKSATTTTTMGREKVRVEVENLEIYTVRRNASGWDNSVVPFKYNNSERYSVMHPCLSSEGETLYFVSDMPGGLGGMDLWYCTKTESGSWSAPVNMGSPVNTPGNEVFPFMNADAVLYFSSDGHPGMGGLDIFFSRKESGGWTKPKNMGMPINSSADDFSLVFDPFNANAFGRTDTVGYFASNRPGGRGSDDIYMFLLTGGPQPEPTSTPEDEDEDEDESTLVADDATTTVDVEENIGGAIVAVEPSVADAEPTLTDTAAIPKLIAILTPAEKITPAEETTPANVPKVIAVLNPVEEVRNITLTGKVIDKVTQQPIAKAKICATQDATRTSECLECDNNGAFYFALQRNARYTISGFKEGYQSTDPLRIFSILSLQEDEMKVEMNPKNPDQAFQSAREVIDRAALPLPKKRELPREYRVQILTNWIETDWEYFTRLRRNYPQFELQYTKRDYSGTGVATRFTYGAFVNISEARKYLREFIRLGYTDAFIAVFEYGRQVESIYVSGSRHVIATR